MIIRDLGEDISDNFTEKKNFILRDILNSRCIYLSRSRRSFHVELDNHGPRNRKEVLEKQAENSATSHGRNSVTNGIVQFILSAIENRASILCTTSTIYGSSWIPLSNIDFEVSLNDGVKADSTRGREISVSWKPGGSWNDAESVFVLGTTIAVLFLVSEWDRGLQGCQPGS